MVSFPRYLDVFFKASPSKTSRFTISQGGDFYLYVTVGQTQYRSEKPKNVLNFGHLTPQNILNPKLYKI